MTAQRFQCALALSVSAIAMTITGAASAQTPAAAPVGVEEIVVTGSRLQATGFTAPTPVTALSAEDLQLKSPAALYEVLKDLPVAQGGNAGGPSPQSGSRTTSFTAGIATVNLRGLNANRTLVLLDGRRLAPIDITGIVDTNLIPSSLIGRVDIVTGGASAAYGSDAISGVVNFVVDDELNGTRGTIQYGQSQRADDKEVFVSLAHGGGFANGRGHYIVGFEFNQNRGVMSTYDRRVGATEPGIAVLAANRPAGLPNRIIAENMQYATFHPGGIISGGPLDGLVFASDGSPYTLDRSGRIPTSNFMISDSNPRTTEWSFTGLRTPLKRDSLLTRVNYEIGDATTVFAEFNYGENFSRFTGQAENAPGRQTPSIIILDTNPYISPALRSLMQANGVTRFTMNRFNADFGASSTRLAFKSYRGTVGFETNVFDDWSFDAFYQRGETHNNSRLYNLFKPGNFIASTYAVQTPNGIVCGPNATNPTFVAQPSLLQRFPPDPGCVPFNPFGQKVITPGVGPLGNEHPIDPAMIYINDRDQLVRTGLVQHVAAFNLAGSPFSTWAGDVQFATGYEFRREEASVRPTPVSTQYAGGNRQPSQGAITVNEGYVEFGVPLLADVDFAQALDFNGAARYTNYNIVGGVMTWKLGLNYVVSDSVRFRTTRSRDIRAPNYDDLFNVGIQGPARGITNPRTGVTADTTNMPTPNRNLKPEKANTVTAGAVFEPEFAPGLSLSADYFRISLKDVIATIALQDIVNYCTIQNVQDYCQYINFDPSTPLGISGIRSTTFNLNRQLTSGFDFEAAYTARDLPIPGEITIKALATNVREFKTTDTVRTVDRIRQDMPKWALNGTITYTLDQLTTHVGFNYKSARIVNADYTDPTDPGYNSANLNTINDNHFPSAWYMSLGFAFDLSEDIFGADASSASRLVAFANVDNVLDKDPPYAATFAANGFGGSQYDLVGRRFRAGLRFGF